MTPSELIHVGPTDLTVTLDRFDQAAYDLFLRAKQLPEKRMEFDVDTDTYKVVAPARFAHILDATLKASPAISGELALHLFDYQRWIVETALEARRYAVWADTGLGKTAMMVEWARQVAGDGGALILEPNRECAEQTRELADDYYGGLPIEPLYTRQDLEAWLTAPRGLAVSTHHMLAREGLSALRRLAGLVLNESSILKTGGGSIKWNLIHSAKGIPYKLSATATPAPNDTMEYASQASFLEKLRSEGDILWTYFTRDKRGNWRVKPHARDAFYAFMAGWSIYMRDPASYGFAPILDSLPPPVYHEHRVPITQEQLAAMQELLTSRGRGLFDTAYSATERQKLAQIARGFLYEGSGSERTTRAIASRKPDMVARLVSGEADEERPTIVWTNFDAESEMLGARIREVRDDLKVAELDKSTEHAAEEILRGFRREDTDVLITKPQRVGYGLNFQRCRAMVFSGIDDSFERRYQAVRRAYRLGQRYPVHVHVPHVPELEGLMVENVGEKEAQFEADVALAESRYVRALGGDDR